MSDGNKGGEPDVPTRAATPDEPAVPRAAAGRAGKWRRRGRRIAVIAVVAVLLFRVALSVLLPTVVHRTARSVGFDLTYGRLDLNLLGTQAGIWDVTLRPKDQPDRILHADYGFANISSLALFKLKLRAYRLEVDGMQVAVVRKPDGSIPLMEQLAAALESKEPPPPAEPLRFDSPMAVEAVRINHVKLNVRDESVSPPYEDTFTLGVRVSNVGSPAGPATLDLELFSRSTLQAFRLQGEADLKPEALNAKLTFSMFGLRLHDARAHLASLGLRTDQVPISMTGAAEVALKTMPGKPGALSGSASIYDVRLTSGREDAVRLTRGQVSIQELSPSSLHVSRVEAEGGLLKLERTSEGALTFASLSPGKAGAAVAPAPASPKGQATTAATAPAGTPFSWRLDALAATDLTGEFRDGFVAPERRFAANVRTLEVKNLASGARQDASTLKLVLTVPELAESVQVVGTVTPFADPAAATIDFEASGVRAEALRPYLTPLGIEPTLRAGRFHATLAASASGLAGDAPTVALTLNDVQLDDRGSALVNLKSVRLAGLRHDPATGEVEVAEIAAVGPSLTVRRIDRDTIEFPGVRYRAVNPTPASATESQATSVEGATRPTPAAGTVPVVRVGKLTWGGANIRLEDHSAEALEPIDLSDAQLGLEGFVLDLRPDAPVAPPGKVSGRFSSPGVVESVRVDGSLTPGRGSLAADLAFAGSGMNLTRLAPYLRPLGLEPRLVNGSLKSVVRASVTRGEDTLRLAADVRDAELKDGGVRLLGLDRLSAEGVDVSPAGYRVGTIAITGAYARLERDTDGGLIAGGVKVLPPAPSTQPAEPATQPVVAATQPAVATTQPIADLFTPLASVPPIALGSLKVDSAELDWTDRATRQPVELKVTASGNVESLAVNQPQTQTAKYGLDLSIPAFAQRIRVEGTINPDREQVAAAARVDADGLNPAALATYLPEGVEAAMSGGSLKTSVAVTIGRHPEGGLNGALTVDTFSLKDGAADPAPLAAIEKLHVGLDRFNPSTGDVALSKVSLDGAEARLARESDGALALLGLRIVPPAVAAPAPGEAPGDTAPASTQPSSVDVREIVAQSKLAMPLLSLDALDVRLKRVSFRDDLRKAEQITLADCRVSNDGPIRLLGAKPESNPAIKLVLSAAIEPVVKHVDVRVHAAPFAERPTAKVTVDTTGIDGTGLTRVAPELAERVDGSALKDGRFRTTLEAEANVRRRGPTQIDLSRGLEMTTFALTQTELRSGESGPVLAGVGAVRGEQAKLDTRTGDVTVRSLEITDLAANAWRDAGGIHVFGMRIKGTEAEPDKSNDPPIGTQEAEASTASQAEVASAEPAPSTPSASAMPKREIRIDRVTISGLDFRFEDRALDPPVLIPITSLDAEVQGLSSLALERERPTRFNVSLGAGKVSLPKKLRGGVLTGALGDIGKLASGEGVDTASELEERDFFAQIVAAGSIKLYPKPTGRAQASVNGIELAAIRGLAAPSGISLNGGTFDGRIEMKTRDDEKLDVRSRFVLTDLSVTEPANGPIVRYLGLPAPLDVVIGAAEATDKSITLPLHFQVDGASPKGIGPAAVGAVSQVLVTAVASAPVKTVTGVVGLFGDTTKEMEVVEDPPVYLEFRPGLTSLDAASERTLAALLTRAKRDKNFRVVVEHELGRDDVAVALQRGNPPSKQVAVLAENLRARRRGLLARRDQVLVAARTSVLNPSVIKAETQEGLAAYREVHNDLSAVEDALDRLYDLQRPGAERYTDQRTRAAAIELAEARLTLVRGAVQRMRDPTVAERVRVGTARFAPPKEGSSRLIITAARSVPKAKHRNKP